MVPRGCAARRTIAPSRGLLDMASDLAGRWKKVGDAPCAAKYPDTITFAESTYRGVRGASQGMVWWDAGIFRVEGTDTLVVSTATDELVRYHFTRDGDDLHVRDPEGCAFTYRRQ
jgi:hypothetical protein